MPSRPAPLPAACGPVPLSMKNISGSRALVLVFAKAPAPGKVKTRLMPKLSAARAAAVHRACLADVLCTVASLPHRIEKCVLFAGSPSVVRRLKVGTLPKNISVGSQSRGDLGRKLVIALRGFFRSGVKRIVVLGTDTPWLSRERILYALRLLSRTEVVLGPTGDGGYYLIACRRLIPEMFSGIAWGTSRVMAQTKIRLRTLGVPCHLLPVDFDLDRPEDLEKCRRRLSLPRARGKRPAPALFKTLRLIRQEQSPPSRPR